MAKSIASLFTKEVTVKLAQTIRELPTILGEEAVNFSLQSFDQEAWSGFRQQPWAKRKNPTKWGEKDETGRNLLVKTGKGKRSIRVIKVQENKVTIGAGGSVAPYMRVHNFGFRGKVTQNVQPFTRRAANGKPHKVKGFTRSINQNIPKRQFIGGEKDSPYLKARLKRTTVNELRKIFK